jgi:hypothetical protein
MLRETDVVAGAGVLTEKNPLGAGAVAAVPKPFCGAFPPTKSTTKWEHN